MIFFYHARKSLKLIEICLDESVLFDTISYPSKLSIDAQQISESLTKIAWH